MVGSVHRDPPLMHDHGDFRPSRKGGRSWRATTAEYGLSARTHSAVSIPRFRDVVVRIPLSANRVTDPWVLAGCSAGTTRATARRCLSRRIRWCSATSSSRARQRALN